MTKKEKIITAILFLFLSMGFGYLCAWADNLNSIENWRAGPTILFSVLFSIGFFALGTFILSIVYDE